MDEFKGAEALEPVSSHPRRRSSTTRSLATARSRPGRANWAQRRREASRRDAAGRNQDGPASHQARDGNRQQEGRLSAESVGHAETATAPLPAEQRYELLAPKRSRRDRGRHTIQRQPPFSKANARPWVIGASAAFAGGTPAMSVMRARATPPCETTNASPVSRSSHGRTRSASIA